jgi:hypothetical protein
MDKVTKGIEWQSLASCNDKDLGYKAAATANAVHAWQTCCLIWGKGWKDLTTLLGVYQSG